MGCTPFHLQHWQVSDLQRCFISCFFTACFRWTSWGIVSPAVFLCFTTFFWDSSLSKLFDFTHLWRTPAHVWRGDVFAGRCAECNLAKFYKKYLQYEETKQLVNSCSGGMDITHPLLDALSLSLSFPLLFSLLTASSPLIPPSFYRFLVPPPRPSSLYTSVSLITQPSKSWNSHNISSVDLSMWILFFAAADIQTYIFQLEVCFVSH